MGRIRRPGPTFRATCKAWRRRADVVVGRGVRRLRAAFATALATSTFGLVLFALPVSAAARTIRPALRPATVLFDDEFGGTRLDGSKWNTCYFWATHDGCTNNP